MTKKKDTLNKMAGTPEYLEALHKNMKYGMGKEKTRHTSEWRPFSELRPVQSNISTLGYKKEFIKKYRLNRKKIANNVSCITGVMCYYEPLEVRADGDEILWRYNENCARAADVPEKFETQFGIFNNHNHGEFESWLGRDDYFIKGNYCDMFDCGDYAYAISNLMHMGLGIFKIVRIDKNLKIVTLYENYVGNEHTRLRYVGRFQNSEGYMLITSGTRELERKEVKHESQDVTILFQVDRNGNGRISKEWNFVISSTNSIVVVSDYVFFGQNKMITRLDVKTGDIKYFTNKTDEELAALVPVYKIEETSSIRII